MAPGSTTTKLARGLLRRCARCGGGKLFQRYFTMATRCPSCGHRFERSEGFWLGAIMINTAVTFAVFVAALVVPMVLTWPDVPWTAVFVLVIAMNLVVPLVFYPFSKTIWVAAELAARPLSPAEVEEAARHAG